MLVLMDQFTRRMIGFGVRAGVVDGVALCDEVRGVHQPLHVKLSNYLWLSHCNGLFQTPVTVLTVIRHTQACINVGVQYARGFGFFLLV